MKKLVQVHDIGNSTIYSFHGPVIVNVHNSKQKSWDGKSLTDVIINNFLRSTVTTYGAIKPTHVKIRFIDDNNEIKDFEFQNSNWFACTFKANQKVLYMCKRLNKEFPKVNGLTSITKNFIENVLDENGFKLTRLVSVTFDHINVLLKNHDIVSQHIDINEKFNHTEHHKNIEIEKFLQLDNNYEKVYAHYILDNGKIPDFLLRISANEYDIGENKVNLFTEKDINQLLFYLLYQRGKHPENIYNPVIFQPIGLKEKFERQIVKLAREKLGNFKVFYWDYQYRIQEKVEY